MGFGNLVATGRILAMVQPEAAPVKRMVQEARDRGALIDASAGRKTKTVLVMDSDHVILSALDADKILDGQIGGEAADEDEPGKSAT
ncbi:MAG: DUF370 domain-containing protein [Clostridia bacterium]|nr:DUF370 domain-containing protein [Clostridia bacterium]NLF20902.1 DUF370 domain-containing protein [Clostridiaceae bacterium]